MRAIQPPHSLDRSYHQPDSTCRCVATESKAESIITGKSIAAFLENADVRERNTAGAVLSKICNIDLGLTVVQFA